MNKNKYCFSYCHKLFLNVYHYNSIYFSLITPTGVKRQFLGVVRKKRLKHYCFSINEILYTI